MTWRSFWCTLLPLLVVGPCSYLCGGKSTVRRPPMQRRHSRTTTIQEDIASLMAEDYGSNLGQNPNAGPISMPSDGPSSTEVRDAVGGDRHTEMRECSAIDCAYNLEGRSCGLAA